MIEFTFTRTKGTRGVVHVRAATQSLLTHMFVRLQEFYESPIDHIRGHYFTLDDLAKVYVPRHEKDRGTGRFTYYSDWHGYNVPGEVIEEFFKLFPDLTDDEKLLREATRGFEKVYLIGSHEGGDPNEDALDHELVHATYYLDDNYRDLVQCLVEEPRYAATLQALDKLLLHWGYHAGVITDELNAYLATTDEAWWLLKTGDAGFARELWAASAPFVALAKQYRVRTRWL